VALSKFKPCSIQREREREGGVKKTDLEKYIGAGFKVKS
jgi:hypothetical protein